MGNSGGRIGPDDEDSVKSGVVPEPGTTERSDQKRSSKALAGKLIDLLRNPLNELGETHFVINFVRTNFQVSQNNAKAPQSANVGSDDCRQDVAGQGNNIRHVTIIDSSGGENESEDALVIEDDDAPRAFIDCIRSCTSCCQSSKPAPVSVFELKFETDTPVRIMRSLEIIGAYFKDSAERLTKQELTGTKRQKNFGVKTALLEVIRFAQRGTNLLHEIHTCCGESIRDLSYYFDSNVTTEEERNLVRDRSAIGSYMWLIVMAMQSMPFTADMDNDFAEIRRILEDIVGISCLIWRGIKHLVDAFVEVRQKTEDLLSGYLEIYNPDVNLRAFKTDRASILSSLNPSELESRLREQRQKCEHRRNDLKNHRKIRKNLILIHNLVGGNENSDYHGTDPSLPPPPLPSVYVARSRVDAPDQWVPFQRLRIRDRLIDLAQMVRRVMAVHEEVLSNLREIDKDIHLKFADEMDTMEMSYVQVVQHMKRYLKKVRRQRDLLDVDDREVLCELCSLLSDEMHLSEFLLMTLRSLIHESRHAVHVAYGYARVVNKSLLRYEQISPAPAVPFCQRVGWATRLEDLETRHLSMMEAMALFNSSPYIKILLTFPISFDRRYNLMLKVLDSDVTLVSPYNTAFKRVIKKAKAVNTVRGLKRKPGVRKNSKNKSKSKK